MPSDDFLRKLPPSIQFSKQENNPERQKLLLIEDDDEVVWIQIGDFKINIDTVTK
jgi:hypothetical protein